MQAVHLKPNGRGEILIGDAGQSELAHDHVLARQQHRRGNVPQIQLAQERRVIGAPHSGRLMRKILNGKPSEHARAVGPNAHGGDPQRLRAARAGDLDADAAAERQPNFFNPAGIIARRRSRNQPGRRIADCDHASSYQRSTCTGIMEISLGIEHLHGGRGGAHHFRRRAVGPPQPRGGAQRPDHVSRRSPCAAPRIPAP